MNAYKVVFHMTNGNKVDVVLEADSVETLEAHVLANGRPFKTFFEAETDDKPFSVNLYNVNQIDYLLLTELNERGELVPMEIEEEEAELPPAKEITNDDEAAGADKESFEELFARLDSFTIETILRKVYDDELIALSLRGSSNTVQVMVLLNVPEERREILDAIFDRLEDASQSEIATAQGKIMAVVNDMVKNSEILI